MQGRSRRFEPVQVHWGFGFTTKALFLCSFGAGYPFYGIGVVMVDGSDSILRLATEVAELPGVGPTRVKALARLGIVTVTDLLRHYPLRYEKEAAEGSIDELPTDGKTVGACRGEIAASRWVGGQYGKKGRFEATLRDGESRTTLKLTWFNAPWLRDKLSPGVVVRVMGKAKLFNDYPQMVSPKFELIELDAQGEEAEAKPARLRPVYPATEKCKSAVIETLLDGVLSDALSRVRDPVPEDRREAQALPPLSEVLRMIHRPEDADEPKAARRRLAYNELLLLQLAITKRRSDVERESVAPALLHTAEIDGRIRERFPFTLTDAQSQAVVEIADDLTQERPMNRMLQGDVGSGKTVVALYALLMAVANGKQGAIMAPTELLAEQHFRSIGKMLEGTGVRLTLRTGRAKKKKEADAIAAGEVDIVVGTHALLSPKLRFHDLAVVVIDEQHRFGVMQRAALRGAVPGPDGRTPTPHTLVMTATPIPRTLSLTLLGDLDYTTLKGLPPGRLPIDSRVVMPLQTDEVYGYVRKRLERGEQCYVVVPAIEDRPDDPDGGAEAPKAKLKSVAAHADELEEQFFKGLRVGRVHGKLKPDERQAVMADFHAGKVDVLVATTVIEVGVDVPNATLMVIEHAERFGLAQLHQLRGRVGRGDHGRRSLCVFVANPTTDDAAKRMEAIAGTRDGFKIAELDLQIRGMGEMLGTRQSGMPPLRMASIPEDLELLGLAKREAQRVIGLDPELVADEHQLLRQVLYAQYGESLGLVDVG